MPSRWLDADLDRYRRTVQQAIAANPAKGLGPYQVALALREVFPRDTIATIDTGSHRILINHVWQSFEPRRLLQSNGLGTMGYALPAAIAAKLMFPKRPVLAMMGEAGLDMVIGEMALLAHHKLALTLVVFRDDTLSLIKLKQERMKLPETGVATGSPDYVMLAEGLRRQRLRRHQRRGTEESRTRRSEQQALYADRGAHQPRRIQPPNVMPC